MARPGEFTKKTQRAALKRAGLRCEAVTPSGDRCPTKVGDGAPVEFDHVVPVSMGGDASLENCAATCPTCHRLKTAREAPIRAKADRQRDAHDGVRTAPRRPIPNRPIPNRPMPKAEPRTPATGKVAKRVPERVRPLYVPGA